MVFALIKLSFRLNYDKNQIEFTRHQAQVRIPLKLGWFHLAPTQNEFTTMNCFRDRSTQQPQQSCQMKQNGVSRVEQVSRSSIPTNIFCVLLQTRISSSHSSFKYINYIFPNPRFHLRIHWKHVICPRKILFDTTILYLQVNQS